MGDGKLEKNAGGKLVGFPVAVGSQHEEKAGLTLWFPLWETVDGWTAIKQGESRSGVR